MNAQPNLADPPLTLDAFRHAVLGFDDDFRLIGNIRAADIVTLLNALDAVRMTAASFLHMATLFLSMENEEIAAATPFWDAGECLAIAINKLEAGCHG